jgi:hypothetical protein
MLGDQLETTILPFQRELRRELELICGIGADNIFTRVPGSKLGGRGLRACYRNRSAN